MSQANFPRQKHLKTSSIFATKQTEKEEENKFKVPKIGGHVIARARIHTIKIISIANLFERLLLE